MEDDVTGPADEIRSTISVHGGSAQDLHSQCQVLATRQTTLRPYASAEGYSAQAQRRRREDEVDKRPSRPGICGAQAAQLQGQLRLYVILQLKVYRAQV
jgi:hypothetical protein